MTTNELQNINQSTKDMAIFLDVLIVPVVEYTRNCEYYYYVIRIVTRRT